MYLPDPFDVTCPSCGHETACKHSDLLALQAHCAVCGIPFEELGREMRRGGNESRMYYIKVHALIELEDRLGREIDMEESPKDATVRDFIAAVAELIGRDRDDAELTGWVIEAMARLAERPVSTADLDRVCLALFATYPEEVPPGQRADS